MLEVVEAKYLGDYKIRITFNNKESGEVDLKNELWGPVFKPLKDKKCFSEFKISKTLGTIVWENDADLAPEFLYEKISNKNSLVV